jgi:hypothetical protein
MAVNLLFSGAQPDARLRNDTEANVMLQYAQHICRFTEYPPKSELAPHVPAYACL